MNASLAALRLLGLAAVRMVIGEHLAPGSDGQVVIEEVTGVLDIMLKLNMRTKGCGFCGRSHCGACSCVREGILGGDCGNDGLDERRKWTVVSVSELVVV